VAYGGFVEPTQSTGELEFQAFDRDGRMQCSALSPGIFNLGPRP
jgi:hypothetical protein